MFVVRVQLYGPLRKFGRDIELRVEVGSTVENVLESLADLCGEEFKRVISQYSTGADVPLGRSLFTLVNGMSIDSLRNGLKLRLDPGDTVSLVPYVTGG